MRSNLPPDYPVDLPGILSFGMDAWIKYFQPPFDQHKFQSVLDNIFDAYADSMLLFDREHPVFIAGAINYKIVNIIAMWYFKYLSLAELKAKGYSSVTGRGSIDQEIQEKLNCSPFKKMFKQTSLKQRLKEYAYYARQNMGIHGILKSALGGCSGDCYLIGDPEEGLIKSYLKKRNWTPVCLRALQFFPSKVTNLTAADEKSLDLFLDSFYEKIPDDPVFFNHNFKTDFRKILVATIATFQHVHKKLAKEKLKPLIVLSINFNYSRIIAAAWKAAGGEVIGVAHGNVYLTGAYGQPMNNGTLLVCNKFLVASPGQKIQLEYARENFPGKLVADAEIILQDNQSLQKVYRKCREQKPVETLKKIMLVGFPMDYNYTPYLKGHESLSYAHLTVRILQELKTAGYYLMYKAHPDTAAETAGFFDRFADEVVEDNFTEVYEQADCLFYISPYSTTFGFGALTNKPMVYVNHADWKWHPEILALLEKRAVSLYVTFNKQGVIEVDKDALFKSIEDSLLRIDHSVVEKYAFGA